MSPQNKLEIGASLWVVQSIARLTLTFGVVIGLFIIAGGAARWQGPSYASALAYPGAPESWGYVALITGVIGLLGSLQARMILVAWSLYLLAAWALFFAISVGSAAYGNPNAGTTGVAVYLYVALVGIVVGVAHHRSRRA